MTIAYDNLSQRDSRDLSLKALQTQNEGNFKVELVVDDKWQSSYILEDVESKLRKKSIDYDIAYSFFISDSVTDYGTLSFLLNKPIWPEKYPYYLDSLTNFFMASSPA